MQPIKNYMKSNALMIGVGVILLILAVCGLVPHEAIAAGSILVGLNTTAFPINAELSAIAIAFSNPTEQLIADKVLPRIPTPQKFKYTKYSPEQGYTVPDTKVGRKSEPNMVDFGGTDIAAETVDYGLDDLVPNADTAAYNAMPKPAVGGPVSPIALSTMMLTNLVLLDREIRVAGTVFNTSNFSGTNQATLSGTSQWSDKVNSDPANAILAAMDIPLVRPNKLVIGQAAWTQLRQHPKIAQAIGKSAQGAGVVAIEQVAELLELDEIIVGRGFVNIAKKGQTPNFVRVWGKHCALLHIDGLAAQMSQPTFGWTAQFDTRIAGVLPSPQTGLRGGERIRVGESVQEVIVSTDAGYFFQNVVA